ncbi:response regulator [Kaarinaea lacus]
MSSDIQEQNDTIWPVLVVDDEEMNRNLFVEMILALGHPAYAVEDGDSAIRQLLSKQYSAVFTDLNMPKMTGVELASAIRKFEDVEKQQLPVILITGSAPLDEDKKKYEAAGINQFVSKPVSLQRLGALLQSLNNAQASGDAISTPESIEEPATSQPTMPPEQPIDYAAMVALVGDNRDMHHSLLKKFLKSLSDIVSDMKLAYQAQSANEVGRLAHKLKGPARAVGAKDLAEVCFTLEQAGKSSDWSTVNQLESAIDSESVKVANYIKTL